ncbi:hypothetical protein ABID52_001705 [Fictibacillus halophilus]|uniref:Uncharacterized protein n=1 Tax=Fictibacillus halophilus TaxID=1610490 RepID=A0ABV2LJ56_9BACL|nr:hypothetical protein [Fictibacillus halophilus]
MEFLFVFINQFFIMGSLVLIISGAITYSLNRIPFIYIVSMSMAAGYFYSIKFEVPQLAYFAIVYNGILSLFSIGLVKAGLYAKHKAERLDRT